MEHDDQVNIGHRHEWGGDIPFGLGVPARRQHIYVIGQTGTGKSTLLQNLILQDIEEGRGVAVIDPHGDLASEILQQIPPRRTGDVVCFDPTAPDPLAINLFRATTDNWHLVASGIVSAFKKIWGDSWGPRLEYVLYLFGRGFDRETIEHFGLGYCSRGFLKGRLAIPLRDQEARLVGYAGRVIDDALVSEENPRYKFPGKRKVERNVHEFRKTLFLYNGFRIEAPVDEVAVVEGFTSVWWLTQHGLPHVVATMGADCSEKQAELIVSLLKPNGRAWIVPDGDKAGERHAQSLLLQLSPHRFVRWLKLDEGKQPTDYPGEFFRQWFR